MTFARNTFTNKEIQIITEILNGRHPIKRLAQTLGTTQEVMKRHLQHIYDKTGCGSTLDIVALAYRQSALQFFKEEHAHQLPSSISVPPQVWGPEAGVDRTLCRLLDQRLEKSRVTAQPSPKTDTTNSSRR